MDFILTTQYHPALFYHQNSHLFFFSYSNNENEMEDIFTADFFLIFKKYKNAHLSAHLTIEYHSSKKNTFGEFSKII